MSNLAVMVKNLENLLVCCAFCLAGAHAAAQGVVSSMLSPDDERRATEQREFAERIRQNRARAERGELRLPLISIDASGVAQDLHLTRLQFVGCRDANLILHILPGHRVRVVGRRSAADACYRERVQRVLRGYIEVVAVHERSAFLRRSGQVRILPVAR